MDVSPGCSGISFLPVENEITSDQGVLLAEVPDEEGQVAVVEVPDLYEEDSTNPPQVSPCIGAVVFEDPNLEEAVRVTLGVSPGAPITCEQASALKGLNASDEGIESLVGLEAFTQLRSLKLEENRISDLVPLAGLTQLAKLELTGNNITDLGPLVANSGLGGGDEVFLHDNPLDANDCPDINTLRQRGVAVFVDVNCP